MMIAANEVCEPGSASPSRFSALVAGVGGYLAVWRETATTTLTGLIWKDFGVLMTMVSTLVVLETSLRLYSLSVCRSVTWQCLLDVYRT